ncbi:MAG: hypothetical protein A3F24_00495 [Candidatus Colwellbacteria bacterium RIFCSPHIGHO2_12_FULL_44_17]|uniref:Transcription elongation factor GreA/GreB C-terminal domain-containing protein n=1 Tax=Candidatus Colwellbacteria bacterium RIFCSPHIGHO2_12_FULL_44_17 TaxID=1797689 RepID=A0A1G1Z6E9_9BACT|nr:MAG: hypothetical protein A3F24_00495 [Candidatus Colwellbacteria bacterium RIFCSPHIGHO2_12_FULL_44_17]
MDKSLILETLKKRCKEKIKELENGIEEAKNSAKQAPSFMESASDTTRQQYRYTVQSLEEQREKALRELDELEKIIDFEIFTLTDKNVVKSYCILPAGGGEIIEKVTVVTNNTPVAKNLNGKGKGDTVIIGDREFKIEKTL